MEILKLDSKNLIQKAIDCLNNGGLIIFPTETAYGVGVDATNANAVTKLLNYKKRPTGKAISIALPSRLEAQKYVEINKFADNFYKEFLPGPVTIISKSLNNVDKRLESENGTLGVRVPNYSLILKILEKFKKPITATSANVSGAKTPYSIADVIENLPKKSLDLIDLVIDAGELPKNPPSTVIDTTSNDLTIIRQGRIDPTKTTLIESFKSKSEQDTINFGESFFKKIYSKDNANLILLSGEMGSGKTHITKGFAKALGILNIIKSPTYNYVNEYKFKDSILYHMDAWRIQNKEDLDALGFYSWFKNGNAVVVEWPSVIMNLDTQFFEKLSYFYIEFINTDESTREIRVYKNSL